HAVADRRFGKQAPSGVAPDHAEGAFGTAYLDDDAARLAAVEGVVDTSLDGAEEKPGGGGRDGRHRAGAAALADAIDLRGELGAVVAKRGGETELVEYGGVKFKHQRARLADDGGEERDGFGEGLAG